MVWDQTATSDHSAQGRHGHFAREATAGEQHQCLHRRRRRRPHHPRPSRHGQANPRRQGNRHHLQRRRHHHEAPRHRPPRCKNPRRHRQVSGLRGNFNFPSISCNATAFKIFSFSLHSDALHCGIGIFC